MDTEYLFFVGVSWRFRWGDAFNVFSWRWSLGSIYVGHVSGFLGRLFLVLPLAFSATTETANSNEPVCSLTAQV